MLCKPGSIKPHTDFEAEVYVLSKDEGGRHTPFFKGYRPQFYFRTTDITGAVELPEGVEMVMPGDNVKMVVTLINPVAMDEGLRFAIREGGRTVGAGVVAKYQLRPDPARLGAGVLASGRHTRGICPYPAQNPKLQSPPGSAGFRRSNKRQRLLGARGTAKRGQERLVFARQGNVA